MSKKSVWLTMLTGANGRISSKRVLGSFILIVLLIILSVAIFVKTDITWLGEAFITMMIGAFALLGIGVFEKRFKTPLHEDVAEQSDEDSGDSDSEETKPNEEDQCS